MLKIAVKITSLISVIIFLAQMVMGYLWQVALMRTAIAYLVLMIIFYLGVLFITIIHGRITLQAPKEETSEDGLNT